MKIGVYEIPFFNYYLIRKADTLPKPLRDYYNGYFYIHDYKPTKRDKVVNFTKKVLEFLFPNRVAETQSENQYRRWSYIDQATVDQLLAGDLRYLQVNKKEYKQIHKLNYYDKIEYALKLEKEGRVKEMKLSDTEKKDIFNYPFSAIKKLARKGKLWSKPTVIVNKEDIERHKGLHDGSIRKRLLNTTYSVEDTKDTFTKTQTTKLKVQ